MGECLSHGRSKRSDDNDQFKSYLIDDFNWPPYNESADEEEKKIL